MRKKQGKIVSFSPPKEGAASPVDPVAEALAERVKGERKVLALRAYERLAPESRLSHRRRFFETEVAPSFSVSLAYGDDWFQNEAIWEGFLGFLVRELSPLHGWNDPAQVLFDFANLPPGERGLANPFKESPGAGCDESDLPDMYEDESEWEYAVRGSKKEKIHGRWYAKRLHPRVAEGLDHLPLCRSAQGPSAEWSRGYAVSAAALAAGGYSCRIEERSATGSTVRHYFADDCYEVLLLLQEKGIDPEPGFDEGGARAIHPGWGALFEEFFEYRRRGHCFAPGAPLLEYAGEADKRHLTYVLKGDGSIAFYECFSSGEPAHGKRLHLAYETARVHTEVDLMDFCIVRWWDWEKMTPQLKDIAHPVARKVVDKI